jgi:hypothetical protein
MTKGLFLRIAAAAAVAIPTAALAQASPGAELIGLPIQVTTAGVTNIDYLDPGGALRILTPATNTVTGTWQIAGGQLCLNVGGSTECIPYNAPFQAGVPQVFTTSCNASTTWLAQVVNNPAAGGAGESGY